MAEFTEGEVQVLIALIELACPKETPNNNFYKFFPKTIEEAAAYFKGFREDWTPAYLSLEKKGLVQKQNRGYSLTAQGILQAARVRDERPPIYYWYREFYTLTASSKVFSRFCERLYGKDLCQASFCDMEQLNKLVEVTRLGSHSQALDLGCGAGHIAEYLSDLTQAHFWGVDYSTEAINRGQLRTQSKRDRLAFKVGNLDFLDFPARSFDTILSIDTLYMPNDLNSTIQQMVSLLVPGGQMGILYSQSIWDAPDGRNSLRPERTLLGQALQNNHLPFCTWDFSEQNYVHLQKKYVLGLEMRPEFEAEGTLVLNYYILAESESSQAPYDPAEFHTTRYLYHVQLQ